MEDRSGSPRGDRTRLRNQMDRLFHSHVQLIYEDEQHKASVSSQVADRTDLWWNPKRPDEPSLWDSKILLSEAFFNEIIRHPVPLDMNTLKALKRCALGLDLYLWPPIAPSPCALHNASPGGSCTASSERTRPRPGDPGRNPGGGGASGGTAGAPLGRGGRVMVTKMSAPGRSFGGVADYCLHDRWVPGLPHPESAERVEWTETRNLATEQGDRAARIMAATAEASPELKRLAGAATTGRKLEKPVCHYSLNWAKEEKPDRQEMLRAAEGSLKALGIERRQALIVSHRDGQPHVHVIANRVEPASGKAAGLSRSKLRLSKWAERYEREQGKIRCPARERNNKRREAGERVVDGRGHSGGRFRRERMSPQREPRETIPAQREGPERERVAWHRAEERMHWERIQQWREKDLGKLERWRREYNQRRPHSALAYRPPAPEAKLPRFQALDPIPWNEL